MAAKLTPSDFFRCFNTAVSNFISALRESFPASAELRAIQGAYSLAAKSSLRLPHETFARCVMIPYGERLRAKDASFFLEQDFRDAGVADSQANLVATIKGLWRQMTDSDRDTVMSYIENLLGVHDAITASLAS